MVSPDLCFLKLEYVGPERSGILFLLLIHSVFINRNILNRLPVLLVFGPFVGYWGGIITCRQVGFKQLEAYLSVICLLVASLFKLGSVILSMSMWGQSMIC